MKKIISFEKELNFPSMIGLITSIALDHNLKFISKNEIEGNFTVSGTYKMTEASTLEEDFKYDIPASISLTEKLDLDSAIISIDDFHYEIVNEDRLNCKIDLLVNGIEEVDLEEVRECDGDHQQKIKEEIEKLDKQEEVEEINKEENTNDESIEINNKEENIEILPPDSEENGRNDENDNDSNNNSENNISSLFDSFSDDDETFTTYSVYIYRKDDTLENIIAKYNTNMDDLSNYNDLSSIEIGSKIIIPNTNNE